jgi:S-adenosylmethionine:tRNA ribosyltransferase-isomerase
VCQEEFETVLHRIGHTPLPPYIRRSGAVPGDDRTSYQTIYAAHAGAVAAPTAGFHFTSDLLERIRSAGVTISEITLHVGYGTFKPVRVTDIRDHRMHAEWYRISDPSADIINQAKEQGRRIIAVGTTSVRTLEYAARKNGKISGGRGYCDLYIYPGFRFQIADAVITNFHLPESTLLMLVSAFAGRDAVMKAYQEAIDLKYRFYSYGDAMLIY